MRLLYIVHQFFPEFASGTERVTLNLARMAQRAGHRVDVLTCTLDPRQLKGAQPGPLPGTWVSWVEGVPVCYLDRAQLSLQAETTFEVNGALRDALVQWMQQREFDVVHVMHSMRMGTAIAAALAAGVPLVASLTDFHPLCLRTNLVDQVGDLCAGPQQGVACRQRCSALGWAPEALARRLNQAATWLRSTSACIAPSEFVAQRYRAELPDLPLHVIPHGVDGLRFLDLGAKRPPPAPSLRLLFIGSLIEIKGLHVVLQALAQHPKWPITVDVAGGLHGDPVYQQRIRQAMQADPRVTWHGQQPSDDVLRLLGQAHVLLLPSLVPETFSLALHEGFAAGLPALVSDQGAPADRVRATGAGCTVPMGSVEAWEGALADLVKSPDRVTDWAHRIQPPLRIEEEAFLTESLYWAALAGG
ncbi:glycosyltransferase family 4 protein [Inhella gelatinilytica]|uniref:Glycosyltransferase family 4 protein n=1 Tax=Inhella gelatinilytica TaxID=2795030 RepID=A0A931J0J9_9BURK|nr:glycosyltransferase family 4 protein [Inhella gelatinilytica]MBH9553313.1 glycosyltransferase family 4 protein [Inhella gelatinilytica]